MNLDRSQINLSTLRTNAQFKLFVEFLQNELSEEREKYETQAASEYQRGRVNLLAELLEALKNNHTGKR
ncbi:TPA: hypothetical protein ACMFQN_005264 [Pseudomonas aeruginosa]|uniref:hypothetical protein n=1 Tax=Pseudomonas aeruginosa TaxID=287 RepID=UPI00245433C5|nr:hypothetical protein [Pseudomonas aeruginosa]MDH4704159.1 hypothetical protein [Pseudomonas aeruginosa]